jgi:F-type H+-transporting ATPase subunit a
MDLMSSFEVKSVIPLELFGLDLSITNSALFMICTVFVVLGFFFAGTSNPKIVPGRAQIVVEKIIEFVYGIIRTESKEIRMALLPYMCSLFLFLALGNVIGLVPFAFSFTSQLITTLGLALTVFVASIIVGVCRNGLNYFRHFCPEGIPIYIVPLFVVIEMASFMFRPISLGIRLFANIISGHLIIKVLAGFAVALVGTATIASALVVVPVAVDILLNIFKFAICILQAYVFVVLTCIYLTESIKVTSH